MAKIAIDVVLLPPEEIMDQAIEINKKLKDDPIQLNKKNCLPHISLCMGLMDQKDFEKIKKILLDISKDFSGLNLNINKICNEKKSFKILYNEQLQKLHEKIMINLSPYLTYDAKVEHCFSPPNVVEKTLFWINNYKKNHPENFDPHITLGRNDVEEKDLNLNFVSSRLALCHLGNYCTCRKILYEINLKKDI
jgi:2'-5' RNA ligase